MPAGFMQGWSYLRQMRMHLHMHSYEHMNPATGGGALQGESLSCDPEVSKTEGQDEPRLRA